MASEAQSSVCCSAKEGALKTNSEAINNARSSFLSDTVNHFVSERLREKKRQYLLTLKLGVFFFAICIAIDLILVAFTDQLIRTKWVLTFSVSAFYSAGMLTISVCPLDELDLDESITSHPGFRTIIFVLLAGQFIGYGWVSYPHAPAYVFFLQSLPCLWIVFGGRRVHADHNPRATTLFSWSLILDHFAGGLSWFTDRWWWWNVVRTLNGTLSMVFAVLLIGRLVYVKYCFKGLAHCYPTLSFYEIFYGHTVGWACMRVTEGLASIYFSRTARNGGAHASYGYGLLRLATGLVAGVPPLMVAVYGREAIFGFMSRRFDHASSTRDGAFLAELFMKDIKYFTGDRFWLRQSFVAQKIDRPEVCRQLESLKGCGDHPGWLEAVVTDTSDEKFMHVQLLEAPNVILSVSISHEEKKTIDQVIINNESRCVEWNNVPFDFFNISDGLQALSRPLGKHERIDIFVSHSWRDDSHLKWVALVTAVDQFLLQKGRFPVLWIDMFCLRANDGDPTGALQALSVYIMACDRMLVLFGKTYPTRLWCAWELFVIFAFQNEKNAMDRVVLFPIGGNSGSIYEAVVTLEKFSVADATCLSPLDKIRLLKIIDAVGRNEFNAKVCKISKLLKPEILMHEKLKIWVEPMNRKVNSHV